MFGIHIGRNARLFDSDGFKFTFPPPKAKSLKLKDSIKRTFEWFEKNGVKMGTCQVFISNPRSGKLSKKETLYDPAFAKKYGVQVHGAYINIMVWSKTKQGAHLINEELNLCSQVGSRIYVLHFNNHPPQHIAKTLKQIKIPKGVELSLEMIASKPGSYETAAKLNSLCRAAKTFITVDSAHNWSAGIDATDYTEAKKYLDALNCKVNMFHLNGSAIPLGGGKDQHAPLFSPQDTIWGKYGTQIHQAKSNTQADVLIKTSLGNLKKSGVFAFVEYAKKNKIPIICEINDGTYKDAYIALKILEELYK